MERENFEKSQEFSREAIEDYYLEHRESKDFDTLDNTEKEPKIEKEVTQEVEVKSDATNFLEEAGYKHLIAQVEGDLSELFRLCEQKGVSYALDVANKKDPLLFDILHDWLTKGSNYEKFLR